MKIASLGCDKSGFPALLRFLAEYPQYRMDVTAVPCLGMVNEGMMLQAFENGYRGLLLAGCPIESCHNQKGSHYALLKAERVNTLLEEAKLPMRVTCALLTMDKIAEIKRALDELLPFLKEREQ